MISLKKVFFGATALVAASAVAAPASADYDWTEIEGALADSPFLRGALVIMHKGEVVYARGFGTWIGYDEEDVLGTNNVLLQPLNVVDNPVGVASFSKSFAAVLAISMIEDSSISGLDYETPVSDWIDGAHPDMKVKHLLSMTNGQDSGLPFPLNLASCSNNTLISFENCGEQSATKAQAPIDDANPQAGLWAPGEAFSYGNLPWQTLGLVLVRAHNAAKNPDKDFTAILQDYLTGVGACDLDDTTITSNYNEWVAGGFRTNPKDGIALTETMRTGACGSEEIITAAGRTKMQTNAKPANTQYNPDNSGLGYGMGLWTEPASGGALPEYFYCIGAYGAVGFFSPSSEWSAYLHLNDHLTIGENEETPLVPIEPAYEDATELARELAPMIDTQAAANP